MFRLMNDNLEQLRRSAKRLERNARRVRELIWTGERTYLIDALAASAEVSEISRRLWLQLQAHLAQRTHTRLPDE
jgi:sulfur transfer protein SufE